jgi:primosomal protein N' (replication factor Y)
VIRLDGDVTKTPKQAKEAVKKFVTSPGSILLATEMALYYLKEKIENSFIVSIDGLLALPDFRINEKVFNLLTRIRALSTNRFVIQTRYHTEGLLEQVLRGNLLDFYRGELADREASDYPPFKTLIKITLEGEKHQVIKTLDTLAKRWATYEAAVFPAFHPGLVKKYKVHLLLRVEHGHWPEPTLLAELKSLPPHFTVMVEPENIL